MKRGEFKDGYADEDPFGGERDLRRGKGDAEDLQGDYHTDEYQKAEWRYGISILS